MLRFKFSQFSTLLRSLIRFSSSSTSRPGKAEAASGGADQSRNLVGAYESVIGAIYVDGGFKKSEKFIERQFKEELKGISAGGTSKDYKSVLQEYTSNAYKAVPKYTVVSEEGPEHRKHYRQNKCRLNQKQVKRMKWPPKKREMRKQQ